MVINYTKKYLDALLLAIQEQMENIYPGNEFKYHKMYVENENYKDKMAKEYQKSKFKFIVVSSEKFTQKIKNGIISKTQSYKIRIANENKNQEQGYEETLQIANELIEFFTKCPLATQKDKGYSYHINLDNISGQLNEELTVGDYWVYEIIISLDLPY